MAVIVAVVVASSSSAVKETLGATAGTTHSFHESFQKGLTIGGLNSTTTSASTYTTVARDFNGTPTVWSILPNLPITISLSGTSTLGYVPNVGDVAEVYIRNASTTAAAAIVFAAADSGADLQFAEATGGDLTVLGLDWEKLTIIHTSQNLVTFILDEMTEAD